MLVVLEGNVALAVNEQTFLLSAGMAFCSQLSEQQTIRAHHGADSKLRTLSLGMYPDGGWRERLPVSLADEWENSATSARVWQVPEFLLSGLRYAQQPGPHAASRQLMLEGIMLQLLGYALNLCQPATQKRGLPSPVNTSGWSSFGVYWSRRRKSLHAERTGASGGNESK